ncbi:MAG: hypothetical protein AB7T06_26030 [Kofleriaceae bacterium]
MKSARRAWNGAAKAAPGAFAIGLAIGLLAGLPILHVAGAAVILGMTGGALVGLLRG